MSPLLKGPLMNARVQVSETTREEQILACARKLFAEKGYDHTTVSEIVQDAGIAQGTFYLYFSSKKDVLVRLAQLLKDAIRSEVFAGDDLSLPIEGRVRNMVEAAFRVCDENQDLARLLHLGAHIDPYGIEEADRSHEHIRRPLAETLARGMGHDEINEMDPEVAAGFCQSLVEEAMHDCYVKGSVADIAQYRESVIQFLTYALVKRR
jgi:AcrR family transcriptional regulator